MISSRNLPGFGGTRASQYCLWALTAWTSLPYDNIKKQIDFSQQSIYPLMMECIAGEVQKSDNYSHSLIVTWVVYSKG